METIRFKNRFRIKYNSKTLALYHHLNKNGDYIFTQAFRTYDDAIKTMRVYARQRGIDISKLKVESYSETTPHTVGDFSPEASKILEKRKIFSGRGLRYKTVETGSNKYAENKYYSPEVKFAQSVNFSKGKSVTAYGKKYNPKQDIVDINYFETKIKPLRIGGFFNLEDSLVSSLRKKNFGKKKLRKHLRTLGYSHSRTMELIDKTFSVI